MWFKCSTLRHTTCIQNTQNSLTAQCSTAKKTKTPFYSKLLLPGSFTRTAHTHVLVPCFIRHLYHISLSLSLSLSILYRRRRVVGNLKDHKHGGRQVLAAVLGRDNNVQQHCFASFVTLQLVGHATSFLADLAS
jgi:hypothetical protein